jgi:hypothetical protein
MKTNVLEMITESLLGGIKEAALRFVRNDLQDILEKLYPDEDE